MNEQEKLKGTLITTESLIQMIKDTFKENDCKKFQEPLTWAEAVRRDELMRNARFDEK